jgi:hypothetical protein
MFQAAQVALEHTGLGRERWSHRRWGQPENSRRLLQKAAAFVSAVEEVTSHGPAS